MMNITPAARTAEIAQEINQIKNHVLDTALKGAIQIGKRLHEAKALVPYGEWGKWLESNVDYSERKAQEFMTLYDKYSREDEQTLARLGSKTHAYLLSMLPREDREKLLEEYDMSVMSTRELEDEVRRLREENEKQQLTIDELMGWTSAAAAEETPLNVVDQGELEAAKEHAKQLMQKLRDAEKSLEAAREQAAMSEQRREEDVLRERENASEAIRAGEKARKELESAKALEKQAREKAEASERKLKRTEEELEAARAQVRTVEVLPEDVEKELARLRAQASRSTAEGEMRAAFDGLKAAFERLMGKVENAEETAPEAADKYRQVFQKAMLTMAERIR